MTFNRWFSKNTPKEGLSESTTFTKQFVEDAWNYGYHEAEEHYLNVIDSQHKLVDESRKKDFKKCMKCTDGTYQYGFKDGYNKAKEEMQKNGLALQSDMDKTIEQNMALKKQIEKLKSCSNCIHYSSTFGLCHYSMGDEDYDCRGRKWEIKEND